MIYRVVLDDLYDLHTSDINCMLLNPSLELEMNSAGSFNFTLPPTHPYWDRIEILKSTIDVYEDDDLIFTGRVANIDKNWNNERVVECEGALAYFNDSIHRQMKWENPLPIASEDPNIHNFLKDILDNHNVFVGDAVNRQIHIGHIYVDPYLVTREVDYDTTLDILTRMCIDTNGGYLMIRKDPETHLLYLDWLKDFTEESGQPASFGVNLLDFNTGLHAADICTGVLARGATVNDQVVTLSNVELVDKDTYPDMSVDHYTDRDQDILWHREGMAKFGRVVQVHEFPDAQTDWKNGGQVVANSLFEEARKWLEEKNTKVESIEVEVAELSWLQEGVPKYKLGQIVEILDDAHMAGEPYEVRRLPMYKLSCDLSSGSKKVTLGRPPKKELTQISASNSDSSTLSSGNSSGSSSGGGSGSGEECKVHDVRVDGTSVVSDKIANISLTGKADVSTVNALIATVANKADTSTVNALANVVSGKQDQIEFNTLEAATETLTRLKADNVVYNLRGGTEVVANPSETATDDLNTIKIGDTVYDIPGGGSSSTNYGKFTCDVLFVNDPLPHPTQSGTANVTRNYTLSKSIDDYDAVYIIVYGYYYDNGSTVDGPNQKLSGMIFKNDYYSNINWLFNSSASSRNQRLFLRFTDDTHVETITTRSDVYDERVLYKVYGLKFENKLINRSDIYSEEERMIGRWIDGKPLYQKVLTIASLPNTTTVDYQHNITNIDHIFIAGGIAEDGQTGLSGQLNFPGSAGQWQWNAIVDKSIIRVWAGRDRTSFNYVKVILNYTKTTDTADSGVLPEDPMFISDPMIYSEEEQVVGSWTDGKPLYQKTIDLGTVVTISADSWYNTGVSSNDIDRIINVINSQNQTYNTWPLGSAIDSGTIRLLNERNNVITLRWFTIQYTKTTDSILSGPKKGKIVQRSDIYSEEERLIGRWTDGKPLYQITLSGLHMPNNDGIDVDVSYLNIDKIAFSYGNMTVNGYTIILPQGNDRYIEEIASYNFQTNNTILRLISRYRDKSSYIATITFQYTKTTDAPFSKQLIEDPQFVMMSDIYSEEEQVVGRWTDRKPLYQKTVSFTSLAQNSWNHVSHNIANIDKIVYCVGGVSTDNGQTNYYTTGANNAYNLLAGAGTVNASIYIGNYPFKKAIVTLRYTKTTDAPGTGPTKGNLIYLPALYSEEEREVGVWTDGRPLYQKTFYVNELANNSTKSIAHNISNIDIANMGDVKGVIKHTSGYAISIPKVSDNSTNFQIFFEITDTNVIIYSRNLDGRNFSGYITIQYTKTTDQPGSGTWTPEGQLAHHYSTSEKIVGTWIDGSTVYERTWDFSASPKTVAYNSWTSLGINIPNGKELLSSEISSGAGGIDACGIEFELRVNDNYSVYAEYNQNANIRKIKYLTFQYTKSS